MILNYFIISSTPVAGVALWSDGISKFDYEERDVLFQKEDKDTYIEKLLDKAQEKWMVIVSANYHAFCP